MFLLVYYNNGYSECHERGYWYGDDVVSEHKTDYALADAIVDFFIVEHAKSVGDFGCGLGNYVKVLRYNEILADGFDGNPDTIKLTNGIGKTVDLSQPLKLCNRFDWIISLEVGENIPKKYESVFFENLHHNNIKGIILSWAIEGQGGYGHVNEQSNEYIKNVMAKYGYINDIKTEIELRKKSTLPWFKNTIMVFRKN